MAAVAFVALAAQCREDRPASPDPTTTAPEPPRLVSCTPEVTRLLVELGAGGSIVGADSLSLREIPFAKALDLGPGCASALDAAARMVPALAVLLGGAGDEALAAGFAERGLETLVLGPRNANQIAAAHHRVAERLGVPLRGSLSVSRLTREVSAIATRRDGLSRLRVVWIVARDPLVAVGSGGMLHEVLELAGAENAYHGSTDERRSIAAAEITASAPDLVLDSSGDAERLRLPRQIRVQRIAPELATVPALDLAARVRAMHGELYPDE